MKALVPLLTPQGRLTLDWAEEEAPVAEDVAGRIEAAFARGHGHGLLQLGAGEIRTTLPPAFSYWREFAGRFVTAICGQPDAEERKELHIPSADPLELEVLASAAPPMTGAEYLSGNVLRGLWEALETAFHYERDALVHQSRNSSGRRIRRGTSSATCTSIWRRTAGTSSVGGAKPSGLGQEALLDFRMEVTLDGETAPLTEKEIADFLAASNGLHLIRGRWVEVDRDRLAIMLDRFRAIEASAAKSGLSFREASRMLADAALDEEDVTRADPDWSRISAGPWLAATLEGCASRRGFEPSIPATSFAHPSALISKRGCAGSICSRRSAWAPASRTIWGWAKPCRCSHCCSC